MNPLKKYSLTVVMALIALICAFQLWNYYLLGPWTRDGRIRAEIIQVAAQVSGKISQLAVIDDQLVKKGDLLLAIDATDYKINLANAQAQLSLLLAQHEQAKNQYDRRLNLSNSVISQEDLETAKTNLSQIDNKIAQAQASLDKAQLDLKRTQIYAAVDGYVTNLNLREDNFVSAGQPLMALVDKHSFYAIGYFEETKLPFIQIGKKVEVIPYDGSAKMTGQIIGIGRAIVDQSSSTGAQLIQNIQPNYPWVALAQRIPVRIALDDYRDRELIAGSTCTITILDQ